MAGDFIFLSGYGMRYQGFHRGVENDSYTVYAEVNQEIRHRECVKIAIITGLPYYVVVYDFLGENGTDLEP